MGEEDEEMTYPMFPNYQHHFSLFSLFSLHVQIELGRRISPIVCQLNYFSIKLIYPLLYRMFNQSEEIISIDILGFMEHSENENDYVFLDLGRVVL